MGSGVAPASMGGSGVAPAGYVQQAAPQYVQQAAPQYVQQGAPQYVQQGASIGASVSYRPPIQQMAYPQQGLTQSGSYQAAPGSYVPQQQYAGQQTSFVPQAVMGPSMTVEQIETEQKKQQRELDTRLSKGDKVVGFQKAASEAAITDECNKNIQMATTQFQAARDQKIAEITLQAEQQKAALNNAAQQEKVQVEMQALAMMSQADAQKRARDLEKNISSIMTPAAPKDDAPKK